MLDDGPVLTQQDGGALREEHAVLPLLGAAREGLAAVLRAN